MNNTEYYRRLLFHLFIDSAFVLGSGEETYVSKLPHRNLYLLHSFVGIILEGSCFNAN